MQPMSIKHLCEIIKIVWETEITPEYCHALVYRIPSQIEAVVNDKEGTSNIEALLAIVLQCALYR